MYIRFHKGMLSLDTKFLQSMAECSIFHSPGACWFDCFFVAPDLAVVPIPTAPSPPAFTALLFVVDFYLSVGGILTPCEDSSSSSSLLF